jgi:hypothetical protein
MKKWAFSIIFIFFGFSSLAEEPGNCSTFMLKTNSVILVGHNLDESPELHIPDLICINKRNEYREGITWYELIADPPDFKKTLIPFEEKPEPKISWTSKYGSITFNSEGLDFPDGGPAQILDIHADLSGNVASDFVDYSYERNYELTMERAKYLFKKDLKAS